MGKYNSLRELFTAMANSIRAKTGGTDPIPAEDFPEAIDSIQAGGGSGGDELKITNASYLFYGDARLDQMDKLVPLIKDCSKFDYMFGGCTLTEDEIPKIDISKAYGLKSTFYNCKNLSKLPDWDFSDVEKFEYTFQYCSNLESADLTLCTGEPSGVGNNEFYLSYAFDGCTKLKTVTIKNDGISKWPYIRAGYMFSGCTSLETVSGLDLGIKYPWDWGNRPHSIFYNCKALTNLYLYNIGMTIQIGSGTSYGHLLTVDSLVHTIKELLTVSSETLTMGSANLEKIANLYCKIIDDTHKKKTMELCESTDEGAITLIDYASEKGWVIA